MPAAVLVSTRHELTLLIVADGHRGEVGVHVVGAFVRDDVVEVGAVVVHPLHRLEIHVDPLSETRDIF